MHQWDTKGRKAHIVVKIYISSFNKYICVETASTASRCWQELADALRNLDLKRKSEKPSLESEIGYLQLKSVTIFLLIVSDEKKDESSKFEK